MYGRSNERPYLDGENIQQRDQEESDVIEMVKEIEVQILFFVD